MNLNINNNQNSKVSQSLIDQDTTFESMCLDMRITRSIRKMGFDHPTLIQSKAIPLALQGKDILAKARTGSGKTAAYSVPIVQKILMSKANNNKKCIRAVVLVPTRELCEQVKNHFLQICFYTQLSVVQLAGDQSESEQKGLLRDIPDIIISTPTRLVNHLKSGSIQLESSLEMLVIDEADLVLSYGYQEDINTIKSYLPKVCQGFLMSATLTAQVEELKKLILHTPAILRLEDTVEKSNLSEYSIRCSNFDKFLLVFSLLRLKLMQGKILFFVNDTSSCYKLKLFLERFHIKAAVLNSELPINSRHHIILQFNKGIFDYLIATDESFKQTPIELKDEPLGDDEEEESQPTPKVKKENKVKKETTSDDDEEEEEENEDDEEEDEVAEDDDEEVEEVEDDDEEVEDDDEEVEEEEEEEEIDVDAQEDQDEEDEEQEDGDDEIKVKEEKTSDDEKEMEDSFFSSTPKVKTEKKTKLTDTEYGVSRGIDFRNVDIVVNFDFPRTVKNYVHRIGRTARGSNKGIALSFITPDNDDLLHEVQKKRGETGYNLKPFEFKMNAIEGFRYRVEDVLNTVSKNEISAARKKEIELEIINNEKLKSHFEANPKDLEALKHDVPLLKKKIARNLRIIPDYLLPEAMKATANSRLQVVHKKGKQQQNNNNNSNNNNNKKKDILQTLKSKQPQKQQQSQPKATKPKTSTDEDKAKLVRKFGITENDISSSGTFKNNKKVKLNK
ncbi:putative RNA helicase [Heterostelium album PN500]|uniref:RNA helicase n=1 Tax=Heterostelium pallidum (strain ATCC 26659 / Pp 5 / PN500) TaxID=670386 RepID=D3B9E0_HETP5|nr:putative RNA helicase [Heterostelium album PN500]EFA81852.1 putative RNA helicase [Heterostelium album PN500]|eukprot:XP_020433969.1 putative RNA helicase [Heterostelium album PN500]